MPRPRSGADHCCGSCDFFERPRTAPEGFDTARDVAGIYSLGTCFRFPTYVRRKDEDFCGEHSAELRRRHEHA